LTRFAARCCGAKLRISNPQARLQSLKDSFKSTLASLKRGQKGVIKAVDADDPAVQRLMVLGLVTGAEVQFTGTAIGGDPMEFRLFGNGISLRRAQALHFEVVAVGESG
jgi:Fe2+ transport system protein FeoA